jgi:tRNA dimethylallyltransferase
MTSDSSRAPSPVLLAGPTAIGKSAVALALAGRLGGEIVSVDSMQVYHGLDIGTAKPSAAERARVRHHLVDVAELHQQFSAAEFVRLAQQAVADITARGKVPVLCGGTGLYFKAWLDGLGEAPAADPQLRAGLESTPLAELLRELESGDPDAFARIDRHNPRRVVRAVEVLRLSGRPGSVQRAAWIRGASGPATVHCLSREPGDLRSRINARVEAMFARGLVAETQSLLARGLEQNRTAMQALGYRQVVEHLRGARSLDETVALVKARTWQFARRQMSWFRNQLAVEWVSVLPGKEPEAVAARIFGSLHAAQGR